MDEYGRKITKPTRFFVGGEPVNRASDPMIGVIPLSSEYYSSWQLINSEQTVLDFVARNANRNRPEGSLNLPEGAGSDDSDDRTATRLPGLPTMPMGEGTEGADREPNSRDSASGLSKAIGCDDRRDLVAAYRTEMLFRLLEPIGPAAWGGRPVLWPLWADEMVHRTYVTVQLTALLMSKLRLAPDVPMRCELDYKVASCLAAAIRELVIVNDNERLPCSALLRSIVRNFAELFGPVVGHIRIATNIEPLQLAAFKRRALALVLVGILSDVLLNPFCGQDDGHLEVQLAHVSPSRARLMVKNSGRNQLVSIPHGGNPIGHDLASLLEAEIVYGIAGFDCTAAQIDFPV
jgi:hypothetical protein